MRSLRYLVLVVCFAVSFIACAQRDSWLSITEQEKRYAFAEIDNVKLKIPSGFTIENTPQQQDAALPYARYQNLVKIEGDQIATQRALLLGLNFFPMEKYQELKDFFSKVETGDEQQAVLQEGTVSAQK